VNFQHGIIRRHGLKCDICMPASTCKAAHIAQLVSKSTAFLLLFATDHTDLVSQLAAGLGQGMDVEI